MPLGEEWLNWASDGANESIIVIENGISSINDLKTKT